MVENSNYLNCLRNGHLEKSATAGGLCPSRSPKTAKTPAKVHLRLRFQNLGKPRTVGLCGWAAGACDCGPLSSAFIERPSPLRKPSCKVRLFAQNRSRKYRPKVTVTTLFPTVPHRVFNFSHKRPTFAFTGESGYTHSAFREGSHTRAYTAKQVVFRMGALSLPSDCFTRSQTSPGRVSERQTLPLWGLGQGCSRRTQKACGTAMCLCASLFRRRRGPARLRCSVCNLVMLLFFRSVCSTF